MSSTSAKQTIEKLQLIFAIHGLPITLVSDNGSPFQSEEFKSFVEANGIVHHRVPPYHPASNGAAENLHGKVGKTIFREKQVIIQLRVEDSRFSVVVQKYTSHSDW